MLASASATAVLPIGLFITFLNAPVTPLATFFTGLKTFLTILIEIGYIKALLMIPKKIIEYDRPINLKADYVVAN